MAEGSPGRLWGSPVLAAKATPKPARDVAPELAEQGGQIAQYDIDVSARYLIAQPSTPAG